MASLTIRNLDDTTKERLRVRAARHRRSMEEEVRVILDAAAREDEEEQAEPLSIAESINRRFRALGGVELDIPKREMPRPPIKFRR